MSRKKNQLEANWLNYFLLHYSEYVPFFTPTQNIKWEIGIWIAWINWEAVFKTQPRKENIIVNFKKVKKIMCLVLRKLYRGCVPYINFTYEKYGMA